MANKLFDEFIDRLSSNEPTKDATWIAVKEEWLQSVEKFFETVQGFLKTYIDEGKVSISYGVKEIFEEHIGNYEAKTATIRIGRSEVRIDPIGTNLIGSKGRIDMSGPYGKVRFLLVDRDSIGPRIFRGEVRQIKKDTGIVWAWKLVTEPPHIQYFDLNIDIFFEALMEVANA